VPERNSSMPHMQVLGVQQCQVWFPPQLQAILQHPWVAFSNSERPKSCPDTLQVKRFQKQIWRGSPFLSQPIPPVSQRPARRAVGRAAASPGRGSAPAQAGSSPLPPEHARAPSPRLAAEHRLCSVPLAERSWDLSAHQALQPTLRQSCYGCLLEPGCAH